MDAALRLADLREEGVIREIGVTNFDVARLQQIMDAGVPVVSNQVGPSYRLLEPSPGERGARPGGGEGADVYSRGEKRGGRESWESVLQGTGR